MLSPSIVQELKDIVGAEHVLTSLEDLVCYSFDGTVAEHLPAVVVSPRTTEEVSRVMRVANREEIPVVPRGMASGLAAGTVPVGGGIALNLTRMNSILELSLIHI